MPDLIRQLRLGEQAVSSDTLIAMEGLSPLYTRVLASHGASLKRAIHKAITKAEFTQHTFIQFMDKNQDKLDALSKSPLPIPEVLVPVAFGMSGSYHNTLSKLNADYEALNLPKLIETIQTALDHLHKDIKQSSSGAKLIVKYTSVHTELEKMSSICEDILKNQKELFSTPHTHPQSASKVFSNRHEVGECLTLAKALSQVDHLGQVKDQITEIERTSESVVAELESHTEYKKTVLTLIYKLYTKILSIVDAYGLILYNTERTLAALEAATKELLYAA